MWCSVDVTHVPGDTAATARASRVPDGSVQSEDGSVTPCPVTAFTQVHVEGSGVDVHGVVEQHRTCLAGTSGSVQVSVLPERTADPG